MSETVISGTLNSLPEREASVINNLFVCSEPGGSSASTGKAGFEVFFLN